MGWLKKLFGSSEDAHAAGSLAGERVLVADPSTTIQKVVELTLGAEGCSVRFASSGDEAIAALGDAPPSVVIASTDLPGKSALQLSEAVRRRPDLSGTIVIVMRDAFEKPVDEARLSMAGADATLIKPFEPGALIEQLRALRQKRPLSRPQA